MPTEVPTKPMRGAPPTRTDDTARDLPSPGDLIADKLRVERVIGSGGMGVVVAAEHVHLRRKVAVKLLRGEIADAPNVVERFLREARAMGALHGENVVRVTDVGTQASGLPYMVMELLSGCDLSALVDERGRLAVADVADHVLQACEGIAEAHALGIVHRDLKPSNLFLTRRRDGSSLVKVLDFGVSKLVDAQWDEKSITDTSTLVGSPAYMSPEQIRSSKTVDARTDIWSIGVCIFKLATGSLPFESETGAGLCAAIVLGEVPSMGDRAPDVPPAFEAVVMRCLTKDIDARYQRVEELASALRPFAGPEGRAAADRLAKWGRAGATTTPEMVRSERAAVPRSSASTKIAWVAIMIAVVASVIAILASRGRSPRTPATASSPTEAPTRAIPPPMPLPSLSAFVPASASASAKPASPTRPLRPSTPTDDQLLEERK